MNSCSNNSVFPIPNMSVAGKNIALFFCRFPQLCQNLGFTSVDGQLLSVSIIQERIRCLLEPRAKELSLSTAKSGAPTVTASGRFLYSKYDPEQEADRAAAAVPQDISCCVFPGLGLGYAAEAWIRRHPDSTAIILEPDVSFLFLLLLYKDCTALFSHPALCLLLETPLDVFSSFLNSSGTSRIFLMPQPALSALNAPYYAEAATIITRTNEKNAINEATRAKYGMLWLSNMSRNIPYMRQIPGITCFKNIAAPDSRRGQHGLPVLLIAAGPSLDAIRNDLPYLARRCITVCVDTALRFCLAAGVQPDFILLVDPQYWNSRHITGLAAPDSFLVTESAAYPPVFRFNAKQMFLCSSLFPLGRYIEERCGSNGTLAAGGSVATTAWDFARYLGAPVIYTAGLDLSYPGTKTHFTGSLFEERIHTASCRLNSAETASVSAQYSAERIPAKNYRGEDISTDRRLQLYAWWFESKIASLCTSTDQKYIPVVTKNIGSDGIAIPGIQPIAKEECRQLPDIFDEKRTRLDTAAKRDGNILNKTTLFDETLANLRQELQKIGTAAEKGLTAAGKASQLHHEITCNGLSAIRQEEASRKFRVCMEALQSIDRAIMQSNAKELISMIFPGIASIDAHYEHNDDPVQDMLNKSLYIYRELSISVNLHLSLVKN